MFRSLFDQFVKYLKESVQEIALKLTPEADWDTIFFLFNDQTGMYKVLPSFTNDQDKNLYFKLIIPTMIQENEVTMCGFILTAWAVDDSLSSSKTEVRPSQHPDRIEILIIEALSADKNLSILFKIKRQKGKHPILELWRQDDEHSEGRFVEPIMKALQQNKNLESRMN